jgi:NADH dehydrogenase
MQPSRFLILGGTGFVGSALAHRLVRDGHTLILPTRSPSRHPDLQVLPTVRLIAADIHHEPTLDELTSSVDVVVNLVGILNEAGHDGAEFRRVHTELTAKVLRACAAHGVTRLLHMSSLQASVNAPSHYLRSKGAAEDLIRAQAPALEVTLFRPSVIFGRRDSLTNRFAQLLRLMPILPLARADARFAPVHVADVVEAMVRALDRPASIGATYELGGPDVVTLGDLVRYVGQVTGRRRWVFGIPDWAGRLQAWVFERLPGQLLSIDNFNSLSLPSVPTTDGFAALGIQPTSLAAVVPGYLHPAAR